MPPAGPLETLAGETTPGRLDRERILPRFGPAAVEGERPASVGRRQRWAFWLFLGHLFALFGLALSNACLGLALLVAPWQRAGRVLGQRAVQPLLFALGAYVLLLFVAIPASSDPARSVRSLGELLGLAGVLLALLVVRSEAQVRLVVDGIILLAVIESLVGLGQVLAAGGADLEQRIRGSLSHYMTFSGILMLADLLLLAELSAGRRRGGWRWLALLPVNLALFGSLTRSAWVGVGAGIVVLVLLGRRRLLVAAAAGLVLGGLLLLRGPVLERAASIVDLSDATNYDRLCMASAGLHMIAERPVLGQGPDTVLTRYPIYRHPTAPRHSVPHLHNNYLQLAAERGLPSLGALLLLLSVAAGKAFRLFHREGGRHGERADLHLGVLAALSGFAVAGLFEANWFDTEVQRVVLWLFVLPFLLALTASETGGELHGARTD